MTMLPEDWTFDGPDDNIIVWSGPDERVCFMTSTGPTRRNARLIVAAPIMAIEIKKQVMWLQHLRKEGAGKLPGSLLSGVDQSIKYLSAVLEKAVGSDG